MCMVYIIMFIPNEVSFKKQASKTWHWNNTLTKQIYID